MTYHRQRVLASAARRGEPVAGSDGVRTRDGVGRHGPPVPPQAPDRVYGRARVSKSWNLTTYTSQRWGPPRHRTGSTKCCRPGDRPCPPHVTAPLYEEGQVREQDVEQLRFAHRRDGWLGASASCRVIKSGPDSRTPDTVRQFVQGGFGHGTASFEFSERRGGALAERPSCANDRTPRTPRAVGRLLPNSIDRPMSGVLDSRNHWCDQREPPQFPQVHAPDPLTSGTTPLGDCQLRSATSTPAMSIVASVSSVG
jgi:hypothetical protein